MIHPDVKSILTSFFFLTKGELFICLKNREDAKEYDNNAIGTYKMKHMHSANSLELVDHIVIEL